MNATIDLVEFELGGEHYALDIQLAREIVEMMPITPIPRAPPYLSGIINLRGEITTIIHLASLLGIQGQDRQANQKIIVLMSEFARGANVGVIVDDVHSVIQVPESDIERLGDGLSTEFASFVKGIIKGGGETGDGAGRREDEKRRKELVIWIDIQKIVGERMDPRNGS